MASLSIRRGKPLLTSDQTGTGPLVLAASPTLSSPAIAGGIKQGTGMKHGRVVTSAVAAHSYATVTLQWSGPAFADIDYTPSCTLIDSAASPNALRVDHIESMSTTTISVGVYNNDPQRKHAGILACTAMHD